MKKYLLYAWIVSAFCSCSENSMEPLPIEVDADCVDIVMMKALCRLVKPQRWPACF